MKFTRKNHKEKNLVTVSLKALDKEVTLVDYEGCKYLPSQLRKKDEFILTIDGVRTLFICNRDNSTATTKTFPRHLRLPRVGSPVDFEVNQFADLLADLR